MASVTLRGIRKRYGGTVDVINGIDMEVRDGEFMVFVGPSGCGKSTMMRMIAGLEDISEGELRIGNRVANDLPPPHRGVAMVFQSYALYPHMTVAENMGFSLKMAGLSKNQIREQVGRAAEILQITHLLDRTPKALSGGQRQRVAIGRAIVRKPEVFLFDEPLSNLDAGLRVQMRVELTKLHKELGSTMIYVTHDQTEAMTMGDRIAVFNRGMVEQVGAPMELYQHPVNSFVAQFLGSPRMNLLPATIGRRGNEHILQVPGLGELPVSVPGSLDVSRCAQIGMRPESIEVVPAGEAGWAARIDFVERLGDTTLLYARLPDVSQPLCIKLAVACVPWDSGDAISLRAVRGALHLFDGTGACIGIL
ncbi:ABC transporter ATP-binding protein [Polaromonas naphthalenivorans]|uniref:Carbohydrate ABC transporter ATP-binding protein, CUT1 family n=1 Tax=Polaromonas naphthalenivorans (strain CJ2) TaxID=365044 RepID=A1VIS8_POLNA|nr:sn-glycerol-3-phosphate ABC transporter ATP-binding protein UgpC [Polaromonas naphthalenivorans]ABM35556.1 carbohydrate ABC transporter ATP-binding protein, CUT1 family [Polaromonas naphthalenivorans CJ2]